MRIRSIRSHLRCCFLRCCYLQDHSRTGHFGACDHPHKERMIFHTEYRGELGKWWQNSDIAKKLQLSDDQIGQLDQTFYDHKVKLIDYGAEMEKQDLKLQTLLDADVPNEGQVERKSTRF